MTPLKKNKKDKQQRKKRFSKAKYGAEIMRLYRLMPTADLARKMGLTVKQITNFVHRESPEQWARKCKDVLSKINSENGRRGGRPKKKT